MRTISRFIFWLTGWKAIGDCPKDIDKAIFMVAPHTSNWDFPIGRLYAWIAKVPVRFLIKKEVYRWPFGWFFDKMGGVPVDRKNGKNTVEVVANLFPKYEKIYIAITPEGTRKLATNWKKGFYFIALKADVPIFLYFIDYKKKSVGFGKQFVATGNYEEDLKNIKDFYKDKTPKHPEKFSVYVENQKK
jgi:1-acyl-sn-glycerol-3-phosphate acyltransferase